MVCPCSRPVSFMNVCMLQEQSVPYSPLSLHRTKIMLARNLPWICQLYSEQLIMSSVSFTELLMGSSTLTLTLTLNPNPKPMLKNPPENKEILEMRAGRITASNFHQMCHTNSAKPSLSLIKQIYYGSNFQSAATD